MKLTDLTPEWKHCNILTVARALSHLIGGDNFVGDSEKQLVKKIGKHNHYVFFLIDAFGWNLIPYLSNGGILKFLNPEKISSLFPSTTTSVLTSISTLQWPAEHGLLEWWTYLEDENIAGAILPYQERETGADMDNWFPYPEQIIPMNRWPTEPTHKKFSYMPGKFSGSPYTRISLGDSELREYELFSDGIDDLIYNIKNSNCDTYSYFYYPEVDSSSHIYGPTGTEVHDCLREADFGIKKLRESIPAQECRIIVSADHGQMDVKKTDSIALKEDHPILSLLKIPPTGGSRTPFFHVIDGKHQEFKKMFEDSFKDEFELISAKEFAAGKYLGPVDLSKTAEDRLGDFIAMPSGDNVMFYHPENLDVNAKEGFHGGPSMDEMEIPLYIL